jgi:hypothetical protein
VELPTVQRSVVIFKDVLNDTMREQSEVATTA